MPVDLPVTRVAALCNPFLHEIWDNGRVSRADVARALKEGRLVSTWGTTDDAGRIAWFVENPSDDPIDIDVGIPSMGCFPTWPLMDGNHRLAAAIYARRETIRGIVGGSMDYALELFGVDCHEPENEHEGAEPEPA